MAVRLTFSSCRRWACHYLGLSIPILSFCGLEEAATTAISAETKLDGDHSKCLARWIRFAEGFKSQTLMNHIYASLERNKVKVSELPAAPLSNWGSDFLLNHKSDIPPTETELRSKDRVSKVTKIVSAQLEAMGRPNFFTVVDAQPRPVLILLEVDASSNAMDNNVIACVISL